MRGRIGSDRQFALITVFLLALGVRLGLMTYRECIETDGVAYVQMARDLAENLAITDHLFPPLYPALVSLLALLGSVTGLLSDYEIAGRLVSALFGALLVAPAYWLGEKVYGRKVALYTAVLIAFYPALVDSSTRVLTESTFTFIVTVFFVVSLAAFDTHRLTFFLGAGALLGAGYLMRPEALGYVAYGALAYVLLYFVRRRGGDRLEKTILIANLASFVGAAAVVTVPYMILVGGISGKTEVTLTIAQAVGQSQFTRAIDEAQEHEGTASPSLLSALAAEPIKTTKRWFMNAHLAQKYVLPGLFPPLILGLIAIGLMRLEGRWREMFLLFCWVPYLAVLFFYVDARFFQPLVPAALIFAARGVEGAEGALSRSVPQSSRKALGPVLLVVVVASLLPYTLRPLYRPDENVTYREAGVWLRELSKPGLRIMDRKPWVAYYAGAEHVRTPIGEWEAVLEYGKAHRVTHLIVDDKVVPDTRPELAFLLSGRNLPAGIRLANEFRYPHAVRVLVYEFQ
jgi:4-amino-4-deoxy-L-arabinose transferase-like glycosyltransferase